eukprot:170957-Chlamydomonas_euryale.AAC.14
MQLPEAQSKRPERWPAAQNERLMWWLAAKVGDLRGGLRRKSRDPCGGSRRKRATCVVAYGASVPEAEKLKLPLPWGPTAAASVPALTPARHATHVQHPSPLVGRPHLHRHRARQRKHVNEAANPLPPTDVNTPSSVAHTCTATEHVNISLSMSMRRPARDSSRIVCAASATMC